MGNGMQTYHKHRIDGMCPRCGNPSVTDRIKCEQCLSRDREVALRSQHRIKDVTFAAYGGYVCKTCGTTDPDVLTLDHINGGGEQQRKLLGRQGVHFFRWLRQQGYPDGFQVLCLNCNRKKFMVALRTKEISIYQFVNKEA